MIHIFWNITISLLKLNRNGVENYIVKLSIISSVRDTEEF